MIGFRPLPVMTLAALPALALLTALGVWQLDRAEEKRGLLAAHEAGRDGEVHEDLAALFCSPDADPVGGFAEPRADVVGDETRFFGARGDGPAGWRVLRLVRAPDCACDGGAPASACGGADRYVAVETDFAVFDGARLGAPDRLVVDAAPRPNAFTSQNDAALGDYYRWDAAALARAFGVEEGTVVEDLWMIADTGELPPDLANMPPSRHIGYALTWFGLAIVLVGVYLAYHVRQGRLGGA